MTLLSNILKIIFCICLLIAGILIGKFHDFSDFTLSTTLDPVNISSSIATIILAILIALFFDKRRLDNRIEKDIILRRVVKLHDVASQLKEEAAKGKITLTEASSGVKRLNTSIQSIYQTVEKCHFSIDAEIKSELKESIINLRDILTKTPTRSNTELDNNEITVANGTVIFTDERIAKIESVFEILHDKLFELEILINKK